jgi:hypothetical protein
MRALILGTAAAGGSDDLARPIAGAPLLVRQLEQLRAVGVTHAVINRVADVPLAASLRGDATRATGVHVTWIPSAAPLDRRELARRAGLREVPVLVIPHGRVGDVDLAPAFDHAARTAEDVTVRAGGLTIDVWHPGPSPRAHATLDAKGWLADVHGEATAQALTEDLLLGRRAGIEIRGSEMAPGVWTSRGATISRGAIVEAPCYFGPGAFVADGARVGPGAILGEGAVVERAASIRHARVADRVVVGNGLRLERACAQSGMLVAHEGDSMDLDDPLLVGERRSVAAPSRLAAAAAVGAIAPVALAFGGAPRTALRRLARVVTGSGTWLGVRGDDPDAAVFDIEHLLVPTRARDDERAAARAFYQSQKSVSLDARLILAMLIGGTR